MTSAEFITKWHLRFADNNTGEISEADLREFTSDMAAFFGAGSPLAAPAGVSWIEPPTLTISDRDIIATEAEAEYGEDLITFPAETISVDFAGSGMKRKDVYGAYYLDAVPHFGTVTGTEVAANAIAFSPVIPEGFLPLSYLDITDGSVLQAQPISEKFKGKWFETLIEADTYWLTSGGIWRAKRKFGSSTPPTVPDAYWELVFAGGGDVSAKADKTLVIRSPTASAALLLSDAGNMVDMNVSGANTLTVPPYSAVPFPYGPATATQIIVGQGNDGQTTLFAGSGVTFQGFGNQYKLAGKFAAVTLIQMAQNVWRIMGNTTA